MAKLLIVEDDEAMNDVLVRSLAGLGHESCSALNTTQAMELAISHTFSLIITDVILPGQDGIECLTMIRSLQPNVRCIVITGYARKEIPAQAVELRISDYLVKPFTMEQFMTSVDRALQEDSNREELARQLGRILPGPTAPNEDVTELSRRRQDAICALYVGIRSGLLSRTAARKAYARVDYCEDRYRRAIQPKQPEVEKIQRLSVQYATIRRDIISYRGESGEEDGSTHSLTVEEFDKLHRGIATSKIGLLDLEYAPLLRRAPEQKLQSTLRLLELKRRVWG